MKVQSIVEFLAEKLDNISVNETFLDIDIERISGLVEAVPGSVSFYSDAKRSAELSQTQASVVFIKPEDSGKAPCAEIQVSNPYLAYAYTSQLLYSDVMQSSIHPSAILDASVVIPECCKIEAGAVIEAGVTLSEGCWIGANSYLGKDSSVGQNSRIYPNVTIMHGCVIGNEVTIEAGTVVGGQGFGFAPEKGAWVRIMQIGRVVVEDNVWIGNNCAIDRGAINDTIIKKNTIIDNLVHIAHNVEIGDGSAIAGQVGFSGSTKIGKNCIFAGQSGTVGHIEITDNVQIMARGGVTRPITSSGVYAGFPHTDMTTWQKNTARINRLEKMQSKIKKLETEVSELKKEIG